MKRSSATTAVEYKICSVHIVQVLYAFYREEGVQQEYGDGNGERNGNEVGKVDNVTVACVIDLKTWFKTAVEGIELEKLTTSQCAVVLRAYTGCERKVVVFDGNSSMEMALFRL